MNAIIAATASIFAIALAIAGVNRVLRIKLCPICLGVGGTWAWMIAARFAGIAIDATMLPILLGGSVAGSAYLLEKHLPAARSGLLWKTSFIPVGFVAAYGLALPNWSLFAVAMVALIILTAVFLRPTAGANGAAVEDSAAVAELKRRMKDCC